jgi:hypothetical protein
MIFSRPCIAFLYTTEAPREDTTLHRAHPSRTQTALQWPYQHRGRVVPARIMSQKGEAPALVPLAP